MNATMQITIKNAPIDRRALIVGTAKVLNMPGVIEAGVTKNDELKVTGFTSANWKAIMEVVPNAIISVDEIKGRSSVLQ